MSTQVPASFSSHCLAIAAVQIKEQKWYTSKLWSSWFIYHTYFFSHVTLAIRNIRSAGLATFPDIVDNA